MKKIARPTGLREIVEVLDISHVQKVICTVAYHTSPFGGESSDEGKEELKAPSKWRETISGSFERTVAFHEGP